jgi:hypothetical protein
VSCTIPITFTHKIWGLTRDRFLSQRCHWNRCDENRRSHSRFSLWIRSHIQKGFNTCIRGLWRVDLGKKPEVENKDPFKGSKSPSRIRSTRTAVSYLNSGVIDTAVLGRAISMAPLCHVQPSQICAEHQFDCRAFIFERVPAVTLIPLCNQLCRIFLRIRSYIYQWPRGSCLMEKNRGRKSNLVSGPL